MRATAHEWEAIRALLHRNVDTPLSVLLKEVPQLLSLATPTPPHTPSLHRPNLPRMPLPCYTPLQVVRGPPMTWPTLPQPAEAMHALVGLLRARTRDAVQLSLLQLGGKKSNSNPISCS